MRVWLLGICLALGASGALAADADGRTIGVTCAGCHGPDGQSSGSAPSLSVLSADHIKKQLLAFKAGEREGTIMNRIAKGYSEEEITAVAKYFGEMN